MSDFIYHAFLVLAAVMVTAAFFMILLRIYDNGELRKEIEQQERQQNQDLLHRPTAPYKLEPGPRPAVGDVVRVVNQGVIFWGQIKRIDGEVYTVLVSSVEHIPENLPDYFKVPDYGQTIHILDPHITYLFRSPVAVDV